MNQKTDQVRKFENRVTLAGQLEELTNIREGDTNDGVHYLSFRGKIRCTEEKGLSRRFSCFVKAKTADGRDSRLYPKIKSWLSNAVPATHDPNNATMVEFTANPVDASYVNREGRLVEDTDFRIQFINDFTNYRADVDIDGYVKDIKEEMVGPDRDIPTGRYVMTLVSRDIYQNTLEFKRIILTEDIYREMMNCGGYDVGTTSTFFVTLTPKVPEGSQSSGGFGVKHVDGRRPYFEWILCGADKPVGDESPRAITPELAKRMMNERRIMLDEIERKGYQGSSSESTRSASRSGFGSSTAPAAKKPIKEVVEEDIDEIESPLGEDDDIPF